MQPEHRLQAMAEAYLAFAENAPDYFRLLTAYDSGNFQQGVSQEQQGELLARSKHTLDLVTQVIADGMALGVFTAGDPRQIAGVLWAAFNGAPRPVWRIPFAVPSCRPSASGIAILCDIGGCFLHAASTAEDGHEGH